MEHPYSIALVFGLPMFPPLAIALGVSTGLVLSAIATFICLGIVALCRLIEPGWPNRSPGE